MIQRHFQATKLKNLYQLILKLRPGIVHFQDLEQLDFLSLRLLKSMGIRTVLT